MYRLMQPSDRAAVVALWQKERGDTAEFINTAMDRFAALDNPFPPEDELPVGCTADGTPYYEGDEIVTLNGETYLYDDLDVDTILTALDIPVFTATKEY